MMSKSSLKLLIIFLLLLIFPFSKAYANDLPYVLVGDSIMWGQLPDKIQKTGITIERWLEQKTKTDFENKAVGGVITDNIVEQVMRVYENGNPKAIIANGGLNDIGGNQTKATFIKNWKSILDQTKIHKTRIIILLITPWTKAANDIMVRRDEFNKGLKALVSSYPNASIVNSDPYVGEERASGPPGNYWNIKEKYTFDGTHFTSEGYSAIASLIFKELKKETLPETNCNLLCSLSIKLRSALAYIGIKY